MGRFSLALRPKYGRDEQTGGEKINAGIGGALDDLLKREELKRQERNEMAKQGAVKLPDDPANSIGGRVRGIGDRLGSIFGGGTPQATPPLVDPNVPRAADVNAMIARSTGGIIPGAPGGPPRGALPSEAPAPVQAAARNSIATALEPETYTYEGVGGSRWKVDPLHAERAKLDLQHGEEERKIAAATGASMPEPEARARVLNNLMRYDETFGQQRGSRLSVAEQKELIAARGEQARLTAKSRTSTGLTPAERERLYNLKERELELRERGMEQRGEAGVVAAEQRQASVADRGTLSPIDESMATPEQKAASARNATERDRRMRAAGQGIDRMKNQRAPREQVAARAKQLQASGMTREKIAAQLRAEGYKVQ